MIRLGIWGCGAMGAYHAKRFSSDPGVTLVSCYDREPAKAMELAAAWNIPRAAASADELLAGCDAVSCALIDRDHVTAARKVAEYGLPLFMEKPLGRNAAETGPLVELFDRGGWPLVVNFSKRNAPALPFAKAFLAEGHLGRLSGARFSYQQSWLVDPAWGDWHVESRWQWRTSEALSCHGILGDLVSHLADAALFLLGPESAFSFTSARGRRTPVEGDRGGAWDEVSLKARCDTYPDTALTWDASRRTPGSLDAMTIHLEGTAGVLELDLEQHRGEVLWKPEAGGERWLSCPPCASTYDGFVGLVSGTAVRPLPPGGAEGHAVQRLLDQAHQKLLEAERSP